MSDVTTIGKVMDVLSSHISDFEKQKLIGEILAPVFIWARAAQGSTLSDFERKELQVMKLFWRTSVFVNKGFDFSDWSDLCKECLELLGQLIRSDLIDYKDLPGAEAFSDNVPKRVHELSLSGKYPWWYFTPEHGN